MCFFLFVLFFYFCVNCTHVCICLYIHTFTHEVGECEMGSGEGGELDLIIICGGVKDKKTVVCGVKKLVASLYKT